MGFWYDPPLTSEERRQDEITRIVRAVFGLTAVFGREGGPFDVYSGYRFDANIASSECHGVALTYKYDAERAFVPFSLLADVQTVEDARAVLLAANLPPRLHAAVVG